MANPSDFIEADYLPTGISIKDPRSMRLESLIQFFKHVLLREASHGIRNAFRFKAVLSSRKSGMMRPANYINDGADNEPLPTRRKRRKPASITGDAAVLNPETSEELAGDVRPNSGRPIETATSTQLVTPDDIPGPETSLPDQTKSKRTTRQSTRLKPPTQTPKKKTKKTNRKKKRT